MSKVDELKQRLAAIREAPKIRKHQFRGSPFVKSNDELTPMKTTHFLELAADAGKNLPNTGTITGLADAHSNPKYDEPYFKGLERGDELGVVEQKKKDIRHKGKTGVPLLINKDNQNQITGHEGRHLGRALLEEGFDEIPVEFAEGFMNTQPVKKYKNIKNLKRQDRNEMPNIKKDTRAPIFGRYSKLKQRLAYTGGTKYDKQISKVQDNFQGMRKDITGGPSSLRDHHTNIFDHQCTNEATCGKTSGKLLTDFIANTGLSHKDVSIEGGLYKGPGGEYSPAVQKKTPSGEPQVKHEWLKLSDGTIIDGSSGQFMNQKNEIRQNQRFRVIRPSDPLYKSYEGKYSQSFAEMSGGRRNWYNKKDPMRRNWDKTRIQVHDTDKLRAGKLKQRLAVIRLARDDWDKKEDETEGERSGVSPRKDTHTGKPGVSRKERLEKMKEYKMFMKENPNATHEMLDDNLIYTPDDIIRFDEQFGSGIPSPRVEGFSSHVPQKILGTVKEPGKDYGKYRVSDEPVNVDYDSIGMNTRGESELSRKLEDKRIDSTLTKKRGEPETFAESFTRKFSHMKGVKKDFKNDPGEELKMNDYSQAVISTPNAKKWAKLKQRLSRLEE